MLYHSSNKNADRLIRSAFLNSVLLRAGLNPVPCAGCLMQTGAYGRGRDVLSEHDDRQQLPCAHENHAGACEQAHLAEKYVSYLLLRYRAWSLAGLTVVGQAEFLCFSSAASCSPIRYFPMLYRAHQIRARCIPACSNQVNSTKHIVFYLRKRAKLRVWCWIGPRAVDKVSKNVFILPTSSSKPEGRALKFICLLAFLC